MQHFQHYPLSSFKAFNSLFDQLVDQPARAATRTWLPPVDITEQEERFLLIMDVPGLTAGELDITVEKRVLVVKGGSADKQESNDKGYRRTERFRGEFSRRFTLPDTVDAEQIAATVENGVLTVSIPKSTESTARKITVND